MINDFSLQEMFPVIVFVDGEVVLFTPGADGQTVGLLICEIGGLLTKMGRMEFYLTFIRWTSHLM